MGESDLGSEAMVNGVATQGRSSTVFAVILETAISG